MAVSLNPRAERLLARLPRVTVYSLLELFLLLLIAIQCARLFWAVLTPVGPLGEWKALDMMRPAAPTTPLLGSFDPFFRQAPGAPGGAAAPVVVTALDVRLYGWWAIRPRAPAARSSARPTASSAWSRWVRKSCRAWC
jgi:general secretion pathway protein C